MQKIYSCAHASELEKSAKQKYAIPDFLMMENAAKAMTELFLPSARVLIVCGKGNNGGDGYALARLLQNNMNVTLAVLEEPASNEAKVQYEMCKRLGIEITDDIEDVSLSLNSSDYIVDCIYGTGFHGELPEKTKRLIEILNRSRAKRIACDIPSALEFNAEYTITMGTQKLELYSDSAKSVCGSISVADLGISKEHFEEALEPDAFLIEVNDRELPLRKNRSAHKGKFGHTAVLCGDKCGAAIIAATAAMNFGSGLTSLVEKPDFTPISIPRLPLSQFKVSPSLMISDCIPKKTNCLVIGSGFSEFSENAAETLLDWFSKTPNPAVVLDAGMLTSEKTIDLLEKLNAVENSSIVITPHLSELSRLLQYCTDLPQELCQTEALAQNHEGKITIGKALNKRFPNTTVIMKSANTFIASGGEVFIITDGAQSLAKGGSGDILAGLTAALLAQGYSAKDAAITAAEHHALLSQQLGATAYDLTPEKLLYKILQ